MTTPTTFNLRGLLKSALAQTQSQAFTARNESNHRGMPLSAHGQAQATRGNDFVAALDGVLTTPLFLDKSLHNTGHSGSVNLNNSMVFWLDADSLAFRGFSVYASNYQYRPIPQSTAFDTHDWLMTASPQITAIPDAVMPARHAVDTVVWSSALAPMMPYKVHADGGPYLVGRSSRVPNWRFGMQTSVTTMAGTNYIRYRFDATVWVGAFTHQDQTDFYVNRLNHRIERVNTSNDFVIVDTAQPRKFRIESMRLTIA